MKKIIASFLVMTLLMLSVGSVVAMRQNPSAPNGLSHPGKASQLYLYEKDAEWNIVSDGAWGKMMYKEDKFVFNGHGLEADTGYTLINWLGWNNLLTIESGTSDEYGNVHIKGVFDIESYSDDPDDKREGVKIWLVPTDEIDEESLTGWNPSEYLFEYNLINPVEFVIGDSESASITRYHGNDIYSTTHVIRKNYAKPDRVKPGKPDRTSKCYKLMRVEWKTEPDYAVGEGLSVDVITESITTWDDETEFDLLGKRSKDIGLGFDAVMDGINSYTMGDYTTDGVIAVTRTWYNRRTKEILEYDIMFDTDFEWGNADNDPLLMDLQNIATHEIGHAFGLLDVYEDGCSDVTMYGYSYYGDVSKRDLAPQDLTGLQRIYGA